MKKKYFLLKVFITFLFLTTSVFSSKSNFFIEGKTLFEKNEFDKPKIYFDLNKDFNPSNLLIILYNDIKN